VTFITPKGGQEPSLMAVVGAADRAAEEHQATMIVAGAEHLACVPGQRRTVTGDEHQADLGASNRQCRIIETQPRPVLPRSDVNDRKSVDELPAR
jgi:hypothetical protein